MKQEFDYMIVAMDSATDFDNLPEAIQGEILEVLDARWIQNQMPGTKEFDGKKLVAAIVPRSSLQHYADEAGLDLGVILSDPQLTKQAMEGLAQQMGLQWELMHFRTVDGYPTGQISEEGDPVMAPIEFYPMDPAVKDYIPDDVDDQGNPIPPTFPKQLAVFAMPGMRQWPAVVH